MGNTFLELYAKLADELDKNGADQNPASIDFDHRVANKAGNSITIQVPGFDQRFGTLKGKIISSDGTPVPESLRDRIGCFLAQVSRTAA